MPPARGAALKHPGAGLKRPAGLPARAAGALPSAPGGLGGSAPAQAPRRLRAKTAPGTARPSRAEAVTAGAVRPQEAIAAAVVGDGGGKTGGTGSAAAGLVAAVPPARPRAVQQQHRRTQFQRSPDGATEQLELQVQSRDLFHESGGVERHTESRDERVRRLANGKTVVVETLTIQKVTYLP
mmetsp:Transcript_96698/g.306848  ORF Transcript_96698/g.306848 Transcript_96698/m.306848 type:complete len:182 (-) Transcript_96698:86-631(-)